jgi:hypothetical protein
VRDAQDRKSRETGKNREKPGKALWGGNDRQTDKTGWMSSDGSDSSDKSASLRTANLVRSARLGYTTPSSPQVFVWSEAKHQNLTETCYHVGKKLAYEQENLLINRIFLVTMQGKTCLRARKPATMTRYYYRENLFRTRKPITRYSLSLLQEKNLLTSKKTCWMYGSMIRIM